MFKRRTRDSASPNTAPEAREVLRASSEYWRDISSRLLLGAGIVVFFGAFLAWTAWSASIGGGVAIELGGPGADNAGTVFGFLAAAIASLQILTRTPRGGNDELRVLARNEVLSYLALILVPVALGAGVVVLLPALVNAPERLDVVRLFGFVGASILLAVFAADASLASDELLGKRERQGAAKEEYKARLENELDWLTHNRSDNASTMRKFWQWAIFVLVPVCLLPLLVMTVSSSLGSGWGIALFVAPVFPLTAFMVGAFVSSLTRRQRGEAIMNAIVGSAMSTFLVLAFIIFWVPEVPSADGVRVREVALNTVSLLLVMVGSLLWSSLASGPSGPLRQVAIYRARRRLKKIVQQESVTPKTPASALAWVSLASAILLPPVGFVVSRVGLSQSSPRTASRRMFWWAISISVVEIALVVGAVICLALLDPEWTDPVPGFSRP